jgi:preprotein translocase subunit SecG
VSFLLIATIGQAILKLLLSLMAIFLILLVLVQRGRGGGLAGALGGMGGSSAFGAKAGDVFTRITIVAAAIWIVLCIAATKMTPSTESRISTGLTGAPPASRAATEEKPAESTSAGETASDEAAPAEGSEPVEGPALGRETAPAEGKAPADEGS